MTKLEAIIEQFQKALSRLKEVLAMETTDVVRDSAIQRFEFTLDLSWKALKAYLQESKGIICASPKECFREGYKQGIIGYDEEWIDIVDMRNETTHMYNEKMAQGVFEKLPNTIKHFEKLLKAISG